MNVNFYIKRPSKMCTVYCYCSYAGRRIVFSTGIKVPYASWDEAKQKAKGYPEYNVKLAAIASTCEKVYTVISVFTEPSPTTLKTKILNELGKDYGRDALLLPYFKSWAIKRASDNREGGRQCITSYRKVEAFAKKDTMFSDVTKNWIEALLSSLEAEGYSLNYIGSILKNLKAVMNKAHDEGLHNNLDYKKFPKMEEPSDSIYLSKQEIDRLEKVMLPVGRESTARDLWLVGYYTAMRFSDYSKLSIGDIVNGKIHFKTKKTGEEVVIPANPKLVNILTRYGGHAPRMLEKDLNLLIKSVCEKADINDIVTHHVTRGGKVCEELCSKFNLVSSHTARRSGATNMYLSGMKPEQIMMITGHRSAAIFKRYIRISKEENADIIADNPFFN